MTNENLDSTRVPITEGLYLHTAEENGSYRFQVYRSGRCILSEETTWSTIDPEALFPRNEVTRLTSRLIANVSDISRQNLHKRIGGAIFETRALIRRRQRKTQPDTSGLPAVTKCDAPHYETTLIDKEKRWREITDRYSQWLVQDGLVVWADDPGLGKTTSAALGAVANDRRHVVYLPKHENCQEFVDDNNKPNDYYHLKGARQPREECCMRAKVASGWCQNHGNDSASMCPVYDLPEHHSTRQHYEALEKKLGGQQAHRELELTDKGWHGEKCEWQRQFETLEDCERVVTVQNYLPLPFFDSFEDHIVDDLQSLPTEESELDAEAMMDAASILISVDEETIKELTTPVGEFVSRLATAIENGDTALEDLKPPDLPSTRWVQRRLGPNSDVIAESLAWVKYAYSQKVRGQLVEDPEVRAPYSLDPILAAMIDAGFPATSVRQAIRVPSSRQCPRDRSHPVDITGGTVQCEECGWSETKDSRVPPDAEQARAKAFIKEKEDRRVLCYEELSHPTDLPPARSTLILDATPTAEIYELAFDVAHVTVCGNEMVQMNATVTQILDGQYHRSTITDETPVGDRRRAKIQCAIDRVCAQHQEVIIAGHQNAKDYFSVPPNAEWIDYHASRGLDRPDADALIAIGAPHPNVPALCRTGELLSIERDISERDEKLFVQAAECEDEIRETEVRPYLYDSGDGNGIEVETKSYPGFLGQLFEDQREKELIQILHRVRPIIADETKDIYLLTNVPLQVPVDVLTTLNELSRQESSPVGITRGAENLLRTVVEAACTRPESKNLSSEFSISPSVLTATNSDFKALLDESDFDSVTGQSIRNYIQELSELGLVCESDDYIQRVGRTYTVDLATSKRALLLLSNNTTLELHERQWLRSCADRANGSPTWVADAVNRLLPGDAVAD